MKLLSGLLLILLSLAVVSATPSWSEVYRQSKSAIFQVLVLKDGEPAGACSAVAYAAGHGTVNALTANHCVHPTVHGEDGPPAHPSTFTIQADGKDITLLATAPNLDLAVFQVPAEKITPLHLATRTPEIGEEVAVLGFAYGVVGGPPAQFGHVVLSAPKHELWIDAAVIGGDSGGAVIDRSGALLGVTLGFHSDGSVGHTGYVSPADVIREFLAEAKLLGE